MKILIIEDDLELREELKVLLDNNGYQGIILKDFKNALEEILVIDPDLILLDIKIPFLNGQQLLKKLREKSTIPVIMVTSKDSEIDEILALSYGADDYITKPFNPLELIARVKSQLRRYMTLGNYVNVSKEDEKVIKSSGLEINLESKEVFVEGESIRVTATEFGILELLLKNKGRVFSIDEIYENVWKEPSYNAENTVAVHIRRIREKIEINPKEPKYLKVVWGIGYKIEKYE